MEKNGNNAFRYLGNMQQRAIKIAQSLELSALEKNPKPAAHHVTLTKLFNLSSPQVSCIQIGASYFDN